MKKRKNRQQGSGARFNWMKLLKKWHGERLKKRLERQKWTLTLVLIGFFLGRAMILNDLFPFAAAFFAVVFFSRRELASWVGVALLVGSLFAAKPITFVVGIQLLLIVLMRRGWEAYERSDVNVAPITVFAANFIVKLFVSLLALPFSWYTLMMDVADASLSFVLTLVFVQALSVLMISKRSYTLRVDELICLIILFASIMTGAVGWTVQTLQLDHIVARYFVLLFAFVSGAPLGASVGVILGLILGLAEPSSLTQMSMLAFSGLLAGLLREGKRGAVAFGMFLGTAILSVYLEPPTQVFLSTLETTTAAALFLFTPKSVYQAVAKYVPGTNEHLKLQYEYAKRMRDMTASRVQQFSTVFAQLSYSFAQTKQEEELSFEKGTLENRIIQAVSNLTCSSCSRRQMCWERKQGQTWMMMEQMLQQVEKEIQHIINRENNPLPRMWSNHCLKPQQMMIALRDQLLLQAHEKNWRKQLRDSRYFVAEQLLGVSQVMGDLACKIKHEGRKLFLQEEQIRQTIENMGLSVQHVNILSLDAGRIEIEVVHAFSGGYDECRKLIAPLLSDILGEHIAVKEESFTGTGGQSVVSFVTAKAYEIETGMAGTAKGGGMLSGDSFSTVELGSGKYAIALSDGMGNGERARLESSTALHLLSQLLEAGMDEKLAIKSVNSILTLRSADEVYVTLDLAIVDLFSANMMLIKSGSIPTFIKRGNEVHYVSSHNLPIGILQDIEIELIDTSAQAGDIMIMMTDGVFDAPGPAVNKEIWMKRLIQEIETENPQQIADLLLETVIHYSGGRIDDDMTVVVTKVTRYYPQWATLHWSGSGCIERPITVS